MYLQNHLDTSLEQLSINWNTTRHPVIDNKEINGKSYLMLSYPTGKGTIRKIKLEKGDLSYTCQNVTAVASSKKQLGLYYNDPEKGFIVVNYINLDHNC